ncbi:Iron-binding zinc finger CDGSH type [uncultured archaeon]|nr:Iron-binding zinc finger CDGSH type [uncultured archaeon]
MITKDGPILVLGGLPINRQIIGIGKKCEPEKWIKGEKLSDEQCTLCRCGGSGNKPFCDGAHAKIGFIKLYSKYGAIIGFQ